MPSKRYKEILDLIQSQPEWTTLITSWVMFEFSEGSWLLTETDSRYRPEDMATMLFSSENSNPGFVWWVY